MSPPGVRIDACPAFSVERPRTWSDEHVFPAFSGSDLVVPNGSCKTCNNTCSANFEQKIADQLETTRHIFEIQDRYGDLPKLSVAIEVTGEGAKSVGVRGQRMVDGDIKL